MKELTYRTEDVENKMAAMTGQESEWQQTENAKSTGQRSGWKNKEHTEVGLKFLIFYNDN